MLSYIPKSNPTNVVLFVKGCFIWDVLNSRFSFMHVSPNFLEVLSILGFLLSFLPSLCFFLPPIPSLSFIAETLSLFPLMMRVRTGTEPGQDDTPSSSPRNRVKFLCSHGGKILPRPPDGHLKYVGGETRVVAVPRYINFSDLMKRLNAFIDGDVVLKYQLLPEELDILVTVKSDEDLRHMLDEYDRHETEGSPRLRAFLFPSKPSFTSARTPPPLDPPATDHPYIDAINGVVSRSRANPKIIPITANRPVFSISSACSSPKSSSPEFNFFPHEPPSSFAGLVNRRLPFHKVRSSPTLCGLNNLPSQYDGPSNHNVQKPQYQYYNGYHSPKPPQDTMGRAGHAGYGLNHYHVQSRHH